MNKKWTPHIIVVTALVVFIVLGLACASAPSQSGPVIVRAYEMQIIPNAGALQGKGAVVFDMAMAEKVMPRSAVGGSALGRAADLRSFNNGATNKTWLEQEDSAVVRKQPALYNSFSARYTELNSADTVRSTFNFNGITPTVDYFSKGNADIKAKIAAACAENETDFAVTMVGQIVYARTMNSAPISVPTTVVVEVCLFDSTGTLVSQGKVETVSYLTRGTGHVDVLNLLLDDAIEDIVLMLPALGGNGDKAGTKEYVRPSPNSDRGDTREAGPNETVLVVQRADNASGWPATLILNKGSDNERSVPLNAKAEVRLIIQNGENVMEAQVPVTGKNEKDDPVTFTATGGQITYSLSVKATMGAGNLKTNERFTWNKL